MRVTMILLGVFVAMQSGNVLAGNGEVVKLKCDMVRVDDEAKKKGIHAERTDYYMFVDVSGEDEDEFYVFDMDENKWDKKEWKQWRVRINEGKFVASSGEDYDVVTINRRTGQGRYLDRPDRLVVEGPCFPLKADPVAPKPKF